MDDFLQRDAFPLVRSGGVFLAIVGASIIAGAAKFQSRYVILGIGVAIASVALALLAYPLAEPFGSPSAIQLISLALAVAFEIIALALLIPRAARSGQRATTTTILGVVGAHFLIMAPAFGPLVVALGLANLGNALLIARRDDYPLPKAWVADGALKAAAGVAMFALYAP